WPSNGFTKWCFPGTTLAPAPEGFMSNRCVLAVLLMLGEALSAPAAELFDILLRGGAVYDGTGAAPVVADVAIRGDKIAGIGAFESSSAKLVLDVKGLAVAPGFINMLSWSNESLLADGRSEGEIREGVTTEVMGEGDSMGPLNEAMRKRIKAEQ